LFPGITTKVAEGSLITTAATITQSSDAHSLTGTTSIATIVTPPNFGTGRTAGILVLIPTGGDVALLTTGNIALAVTMTNKKATVLVYLPSTGKWYPNV
jgi:hypothetical protein